MEGNSVPANKVGIEFLHFKEGVGDENY